MPLSSSSPNTLMQGASSQGAPPSLPQQGGMQAQGGVPKPTPPPPTPAQVKASVATNKLILSELSSIANDPAVLADPDRLQKALLGLAADSRRSAGDDAGPVAASLSHVLDIVNDPRGPKVAIRDRIANVLMKLASLDTYSRAKHGQPAIMPSDQGQGPVAGAQEQDG